MSSFDRHPVRRVERDPVATAPGGQWPFSLPVVRQLLTEGLDLAPVTVLVGENGSGKSTIVEAVALAYGLSAEGGSIYAQHSTRTTESPLHNSLRLSRGIPAGRWGFFLRAEWSRPSDGQHDLAEDLTALQCSEAVARITQRQDTIDYRAHPGVFAEGDQPP